MNIFSCFGLFFEIYYDFCELWWAVLWCDVNILSCGGLFLRCDVLILSWAGPTGELRCGAMICLVNKTLQRGIVLTSKMLQRVRKHYYISVIINELSTIAFDS